MLNFFALLFGIFCCSSAFAWIRLSALDPFFLAGARTLLATVLLLPLFLRDWKHYRPQTTRRMLQRSIAPGLLLAIHFVTWNEGARNVEGATASLLVNLSPLALPFFLHAFAKERVARHEIFGTLIALIGLAFLTGGVGSPTGQSLYGVLACLGSMLAFSGYLALGRQNRELPSLWLYVVPVYAVCGVVCLTASLFEGVPHSLSSGKEWLYLLGLTVIPTLLGHSLLNQALKRFRGQVVGVVNLGQSLFAAVIAFAVFQELPSPGYLPGAICIVLGALIVTGLLRLGRRPNTSAIDHVASKTASQ